MKRCLDNKEILLIIVLYLSINLPFIDSYPPLDLVGDESWYMNYSVNLLKTGSPSGTMFVNTPFNELTPFTAWFYNGLLSLFFLILGAGITQGRFLSLMAQIVILYFTYRTGYEVFNKRTGILSALLLGGSVFFAFAHQLRPEALFTALMTFSFYLFIRYLRARRPAMIFLSSLTGGLLIEVHPNGAVYLLCLLFLYLLWLRRVFHRDTLFFLMGPLISFLIWLSLNYLPAPSFSSFRTVHLSYMPSIMKGPGYYLKSLLNALLEDPEFLFKRIPQTFINNFDIRLYLLGGILGLSYFIFKTEDRRSLWLILSGAAFLWISSIILGLGVCQPVYFIYFMPFFAITGAVIIEKLMRMGDSLKKGIGVLLLSLIITVNLYDLVETGIWSKEIKKQYDRALKELSSALPAGSRVMGITNYYPVLYDRVGYFTVLYVQNSCPDLGKSLKGLHIDYFIKDEVIEHIFLQWCGSRYIQSVDTFLSEEAELYRVINIEGGYPNFNARGNYIREIKIYRLKT